MARLRRLQSRQCQQIVQLVREMATLVTPVKNFNASSGNGKVSLHESAKKFHTQLIARDAVQMFGDPLLCSPLRAAERARLLVGQFRRVEANDPDVWFAALVKLFTTFPEPVVVKVTDPSSLARKFRFCPSLFDIGQACDAQFAVIYGNRRPLLTDNNPPVARTPELKSKILELLRDLRGKIGSQEPQIADRNFDQRLGESPNGTMKRAPEVLK